MHQWMADPPLLRHDFWWLFKEVTNISAKLARRLNTKISSIWGLLHIITREILTQDGLCIFYTCKKQWFSCCSSCLASQVVCIPQVLENLFLDPLEHDNHGSTTTSEGFNSQKFILLGLSFVAFFLGSFRVDDLHSKLTSLIASLGRDDWDRSFGP